MEGMYDLSTVHPTVRKFGQHKPGSTEAAPAFKSPVVKTIYVDRLKNLARSFKKFIHFANWDCISRSATIRFSDLNAQFFGF